MYIHLYTLSHSYKYIYMHTQTHKKYRNALLQRIYLYAQ